jgi:N-acyl-D-amino-acid deacylase
MGYRVRRRSVFAGLTEEWLRATYRNALCSPGSDATAMASDGATAEAVFPGAFTWAAWYFRRMVRETRELTLDDAVRHMTSVAADRAKLKGRGRLVPGAWADIVIFDPERFRDTATLQEPKRPAEGIVHVLVNGQIALTDGAFTGVRSGAVLRRGQI